MTHKVIRNHAQSGSGHSLCLGEEKDASEGMDISVNTLGVVVEK